MRKKVWFGNIFFSLSFKKSVRTTPMDQTVLKSAALTVVAPIILVTPETGRVTMVVLMVITEIFVNPVRVI